MSIFAVYDTIIDGSIVFFIVGSRAGGLVRLPGSVGARPGDSLAAACWRLSVTGLDFGGSSAVVEVKSAGKLRRSGRLCRTLGRSMG